MKRNIHMSLLSGNYLFPEINHRKTKFLNENPNAKLISLGIGDTTHPIPDYINQALVEASIAQSTQKGYSGYGPEQGLKKLRESISKRIYENQIDKDEIFISDGAKCDIGRLQTLFSHAESIAVQDPTYPVYVDGSIIQGIRHIIPMHCTPENNFFPDLSCLPRTDLIYFCSPNNPTGAVATKEQLEDLVDFAYQNRSIIIFDAAYSQFIQDPSLPKSIYEIKNARKVAIEVGSFSKLAGFTGLRLGWTIVPDELKYDDGYSVKMDWNRIMCTLFNGASNIVQIAGCAVLEDKGWNEAITLTKYYLENAKLIQEALLPKCELFGGINAPYIWARFTGNSWNLFEEFLQHHHIVTTPGSGFGPSGEGFLRFSAFGKRDNIIEAVARLKESNGGK